MTRVIRTLTVTPVLVVLSACGGMSDSGVSQPPVSAPTKHYRVGGTVTGLSGSGLILELDSGSELPIEANGAFTFPGSVSSGTRYSVTIKDRPTVRREICTVTNGSGMVGDADIGNVSVNCTIAAGFVYVVDPNSQIAAYGITPRTGVPIPNGSVAIAPSSEAYLATVASPSGNFLYVLGNQPAQISTFAIDSNQGGLTQITAPVATASGPVRMVMSPNGSFLFVYNIHSNNIQTVQTFTVDSATGALTPAGTVQLPNTNCTAEICPGAGDFAVRPDSKYLYTLVYGGMNNITSVTPYAIDPVTGGLTGGTGITFPTNAAGTSMSIDPLSRFLYLAKAVSPDGTAVGTSQSATVVSYILDPTTGALSPGSSTVVANGADLMAPDPTGAYLYVIYTGCCAYYSNVLALAVDPSSGALSQIGAGAPISNRASTAALDPSGAFLFLGNASGAIFTARQSWTDLTSFTIGTSGANAGAVSFTGDGTQFPSGTVSVGGELAIVE